MNMKTNSNELIKCGVVGVGYLGQHHARIYDQLESCSLVGFFEPNDEAARKIEAAYLCKRFPSIEELGDACDAVSVVCPTDKHAEVSLPLIGQGCHLLVEKPLCVSSSEAEDILSSAKDRNVIVQVGRLVGNTSLGSAMYSFGAAGLSEAGFAKALDRAIIARACSLLLER